MTPTERILLSRETLALYERNGVPVGPIEATLAMIRGETAVLDRIAVAEPQRAETLANLVTRWRGFAGRVKAGAN